MTQASFFEGNEKFVLDKPIRLIELFAGIGSQAKALTNLGVQYEHHRISEWDVYSMVAYNAIHIGDFNDRVDIPTALLAERLYELGISGDGKEPMTLKQIKNKGVEWQSSVYSTIKATNNIVSIINAKGSDLGIAETDKFTYIMTYSFPCQDLSKAGK